MLSLCSWSLLQSSSLSTTSGARRSSTCLVKTLGWAAPGGQDSPQTFAFTLVGDDPRSSHSSPVAVRKGNQGSSTQEELVPRPALCWPASGLSYLLLHPASGMNLGEKSSLLGVSIFVFCFYPWSRDGSLAFLLKQKFPSFWTVSHICCRGLHRHTDWIRMQFKSNAAEGKRVQDTA